MIVVFGSINVDLVTRVDEIPKPGETVLGPSYDIIPGGKGANQALAARRSGRPVRLIGAVGSDDFSESALKLLKAEGVDCSHVAAVKAPTGAAFITVDSHGENAIVVAAGANSFANAKQLIGQLHAGDILLLQREVPDAEGEAAARAAKSVGARTVLNLAPAGKVARSFLENIDILVMNEHEAGVLAAAYGLDASSPEAAARALHSTFSLIAIVTLGGDGAIAFDAGKRYAAPAPKVPLVDTTAAGDTFVGALAAYFKHGMDMNKALLYAVAAGSLACTKAGAQTSIPRMYEISALATFS